MRKVCALSLLFFFVLPLAAQKRLARLELKPGEVFELTGTDILVVDTLILRDSSRLVLNKLKRENYIHAKSAHFYKGARIDGRGVQGLPGRNGRTGTSPVAPCSNATGGTMGTNGTNGGDGMNLLLYLNDLKVTGTVFVDLAGGDGGDGATGGAGGDGAPGTRICPGGNGGNGSAGSNGGNGGRGGTLTLHAPAIPELRLMIGDQIVVRNYGGEAGAAGEGGRGGAAGLVPQGSKQPDGRTGHKGQKGKQGVRGKPGAVLFENK